MTKFRKIQNRLELLEQRQCLTSIGFVSHDIIEDQSPSIMVLADIDGDNDLDIVMSTYANPRLGWRLNAGDGTFGPFEVLTGERVDEIVATDFDQDGDIDLLVISELGRDFAWYENDGDLKFQPKQVLVGTTQFTSRLAAADVDNDGDIDLLATSPPTWRLNWYENLAGELKKREVSSERVFNYHLGDYDSDGDLDIANLDIWMENNGSGEFINQHQVFHVLDLQEDQRITGQGDLDGDGDIDFLTTLGWYENVDQRYEFAAIPFSNKFPFPHSFAIDSITLDLDGDGDLDLMTRLESGGDRFNWFALHENTKSGFRLLYESFPLKSLTRLHMRSFDARDLDGNGNDDPVVHFYSGESYWYDGRNEHRLSDPTRPSTEENKLVDLDNDGDLDVLLVTSDRCHDTGCGRKSAWFENGNGRETEWTEHSILLSPMMAVGDIDSDGDNDIMTLDYDDGTTVWLENDDQTFLQRQQLQIDRRSSRYSAISLADVDGDFDLDAVLHSDETLWFENLDGTGMFGSAQSIGVETGDMVVVDVEGDGDADVFVGGRQGIVWYSNDGTGLFDRHLIEDMEIRDLSPADMDGDGDQDLLVIIAETIYQIEFLGDGTFANRIAIASNASDRPRAVDLDQDDDLDLVYYDGREQAYLWSENNGTTFGRPNLLVSNISLARNNWQTLGSIEFDDIDQDGDIDVFTGKHWQEQRLIGDVNDDGRFDSSDLVIVFQHAEYEDAFPHNSTFEEGDWNGDGDFNSSDLVFAFEAGHYATTARLASVAFDISHRDSRRTNPRAYVS